MIREGLLTELRRSQHTAAKYVNELKNKRFKNKRDKKALNYWEGNKDATERAIFLAEWYSDKKEEPK